MIYHVWQARLQQAAKRWLQFHGAPLPACFVYDLTCVLWWVVFVCSDELFENNKQTIKRNPPLDMYSGIITTHNHQTFRICHISCWNLMVMKFEHSQLWLEVT